MSPFDNRPPLVIAAAIGLALCGTVFVGASAEARSHGRRHARPVLVQSDGLIPGTYSASYGQPGYGCRTSILAGNFGGCGTGWAYEGGPGFGYR